MREIQEKEREEYRTKLWTYIVKKEIPRMAKMFSQSRHIIQSNNKKVCCSKNKKNTGLHVFHGFGTLPYMYNTLHYDVHCTTYIHVCMLCMLYYCTPPPQFSFLVRLVGLVFFF